MVFEAFIEFLKKQYIVGLPGEGGQQFMMPKHRLSHTDYLHYKNTAKLSAVNLLLFNGNDTPQIVLTQRHDYTGPHGGQVSFPGGKMEKQEKDPFTTAMRETQEELGVDTKKLEVIGPLSELYVPISNFWIYPYITYTNDELEFYPDDKEVKKIIYLSIEDLTNDKNIDEYIYINKDGARLKFPCFNFSGVIVWGATAMILSELKTMLMRGA